MKFISIFIHSRTLIQSSPIENIKNMCLSIRSQNSCNHIMLKLKEILKGLTTM
jgi:hypothetical protein